MPKNFVLSILLIHFCFIGKVFAFSFADSSAIFLTKEQFENNVPQLISPESIKEKSGFLWSDFDYQASGIIRIKSEKNIIREFKPGDVYGFIQNGIKFMYLKNQQKYFSILYDKLPITFLVGDNETIGYKSYYKNGVIFYLNTNTNSLREFTKKNIKEDFKDNTVIFQSLINIFQSLDTYRSNLSIKNFFKCQKIIQSYFNTQSLQ